MNGLAFIEAWAGTELSEGWSGRGGAESKAISNRIDRNQQV
jgi:hypothetical protein